MIVFQTVFIGLVVFASQTIANICTGRRNGEQFPNPSDCKSFYVCNFGEPKLVDCPTNLSYDVSLRSCNWAYMVDCSQVIDDDKPHENHPVDTADPDTGLTPAIPVYNKTNEVAPGILEISPNIFHCKNSEFYFAPHPRDCQQYFICENNRLHAYECGDGLYWDYKNDRCNLPLNALCYPIIPTESKGKLVCSSGGLTVKYTESECKFVADEIEESENIVECPAQIVCTGPKMFFEDAGDCMKYYVCIGGMPIAVTCPEKTAWDNHLLQCNQESFKRCFG